MTKKIVTDAAIKAFLNDILKEPDTLAAYLGQDKYFIEGDIDLRKALEAALNSEGRPFNCRNRLRDEGKAYPRSGCDHCRNGGLFGCPFEIERKQDVPGDLL